ncbi:MAG: MFS transporter [Halodesulfurarchaeum sp.]
MDGDGERLTSGYTGRMLVTTSIGWGTVQAGKLVFSPLLPSIQADFGIGSSLAGLALTTMWAIYALAQYPSGRFSDRLSRKTLLVLGLAVLVLGFLVVGVAPTYPVFLLGMIVVGAGAGFYPTTTKALLSDLFTERRGEAFGIHTASSDFGGIVAAGLATLVVAVSIWRTAFVPIVLALGLVAVGLHVWSRESYVIESPSLGATDTVRRLFARSENRLLLLAYTLFNFTWQASTGFLPTYLQSGKSLPPIVANSAFAVLFAVGVIVKPISGWLGDRFPRDTLAILGLLIAACSLVGIVFADSTPLMLLSVVGFAAGLLSYPPVMQALLMDSFPDSSYGGDLGAMRTIYIGFGSLGPTYVGVVAARASYDLAFLGLSAALIAAVLLIGVVRLGSTDTSAAR